MAYTYAIGDTHGAFDLVRKAVVLAEQHAQCERATFVVCGDFIDRGPQSREIVEMLMARQFSQSWQWIVLKGNHEDLMLQCLDIMQLSFWVQNGGNATLKSYGYNQGDPIQPSRIPQHHIDWLRSLPLFHIDQHRAFVHAGFDPGKPLAEQSDEGMMWVRDDKWADYSFMGRHVVHGHCPHTDGPIMMTSKTNLDTDAWKHGRLPIAVFDDDIPGGPIDILWAVR